MAIFMVLMTYASKAAPQPFLIERYSRTGRRSHHSEIVGGGLHTFPYDLFATPSCLVRLGCQVPSFQIGTLTPELKTTNL